MKKEDLIIKWLDNNLSEKELKAFEQLDASSSYLKIDQAVQNFKAPSFDVDIAYSKLKTSQFTPESTSNWKRYLSGIAAALLVSFGLYFSFQKNSATEILASNSEKIEWILPDTSEVVLNAGSTMSFNEETWSDLRDVNLDGEAYFKVAKGSKFTVKTPKGDVTVVGTQFTVNAREQLFEVVCYEGLVRVAHNGIVKELSAGNSFKVYGDQQINDTTVKLAPVWLQDKSSFTSVPFEAVVQELERQYNTEVVMDKAVTKTLFTGSFTHANLETALQAITIPLNLAYTIDGNKVVLKSN